MRDKKAFLLFIIVLGNFVLYAETTLTKALYEMRPGDEMHKQQIEYKDPGRKGKNVLWDFSQLKPINKDYRVYNIESNKKRGTDTIDIISIEHQTMYKYSLKGSSLFFEGFENSGSNLILQKPELNLVFPFALGDSISDIYNGHGHYMNTLVLNTEGMFTTVADGLGTLILPEGDTLYNVLRIRSERSYKQKTLPIFLEPESKLFINDSIISNLIEVQATDIVDSTLTNAKEKAKDNVNQSLVKDNSLLQAKKNKSSVISANKSYMKSLANIIKDKRDSIDFCTEVCRWYAPGYRYPIFETIRNKSRHKDTKGTKNIEMDDIATAFYFPPSMHKYLENDPENKAILDSLQHLSEEKSKKASDELIFDYNIYPNPIKTDLKVELLLYKPSSVSLSVYTTYGERIILKDEGFLETGQHSCTINMSRLRIGEYLLVIKVNKQKAQAVLIKK
jgi:hypothetical protein